MKSIRSVLDGFAAFKDLLCSAGYADYDNVEDSKKDSRKATTYLQKQLNSLGLRANSMQEMVDNGGRFFYQLSFVSSHAGQGFNLELKSSRKRYTGEIAGYWVTLRESGKGTMLCPPLEFASENQIPDIAKAVLKNANIDTSKLSQHRGFFASLYGQLRL